MERFDINSVQDIIKKTNEIHSFAIENYHSNPYLFDMIDHLARVSGMFADVIEEQLKGTCVIADPQGYIKGKLGVAHDGIYTYKKYVLKEIEED